MSDPKTSRDLSGSDPRKDEERDMEKAVAEDADTTDVADRDLIHGDGGTLGLDTNDDRSPGD
jgi:hypothetical protein